MGMPHAGRAIAYIRVSVVGNRALRGRLESPELQRVACDAWCAQRGIIVADEVRDLNRSGGTMTRPGLERARRLLDDGAADGIIVAQSDRASRSVLQGLGLIDELERAGYWIAATDGTLDTTTPEAKMATVVFLAMNERVLDRFKEQSAVIHRQAIMEKGRHMGPAPFGYVRDREGRLRPHRTEAAWVRRIFERRAEGAGWVLIARELADAGVRQRSGRRINQHMLRRLVTHRVYVGEAHHGDHVRASSHPALVDEALWLAANRARPAVRTDPAVGVRIHEDSLLRGLLRCAGCRYVLKRLPVPDAPPRWKCRTLLSERSATHDCSTPVALTAAQGVAVERAVVADFMALAGEVAAERGEDVDVGALERQAREAEALLDELSSLDVRRRLGAERWARMTEQAREAAQDAQRELAAARARGRVTTHDSRALGVLWPGMALDDRQEALRSIVQAVMVDGARVQTVPVWVEVDLPRRGQRDFVARRWEF